MRLVGTIADKEKSQVFCAFLVSEGIGCDPQVTPKGTQIWIRDEDHFDAAKAHLEAFLQEPTSDKYTKPKELINELSSIRLEIAKEAAKIDQEKRREQQAVEAFRKSWLSALLIATCLIVFVINFLYPYEGAAKEHVPEGYGFPHSKIEKAFFYDFTASDAAWEQLLERYDLKIFKVDGNQQPAIAAADMPLWEQAQKEWPGYYPAIASHLAGKGEIEVHSMPWFEKISKGEIWRVITPIFLHGNLIHLVMNLMWMLALSFIVEYRLGTLRFFALIVLTAAFSNTAQYLVSGPAFLGISGVVFALMGFIFVRQQVAPWEAYPIRRSVFSFVLLYAVLMLGVEAYFLVQFIQTGVLEPIPIANTAHFVGALSGAFLGCLDVFSMRDVR